MNGRKPRRSFWKDDGGQAMVEFALVLPILLLLVCGIIDFGWIFGNQMVVESCAREGARYGVVNATQANAGSLIRQITIGDAPSYLKGSISVNPVFSDPCDPESGDLIVQVTCPIQPLTPLAGIFTQGKSITLSSTCVMKVE